MSSCPLPTDKQFAMVKDVFGQAEALALHDLAGGQLAISLRPDGSPSPMFSALSKLYGKVAAVKAKAGLLDPDFVRWSEGLIVREGEPVLFDRRSDGTFVQTSSPQNPVMARTVNPARFDSVAEMTRQAVRMFPENTDRLFRRYLALQGYDAIHVEGGLLVPLKRGRIAYWDANGNMLNPARSMPYQAALSLDWKDVLAVTAHPLHAHPEQYEPIRFSDPTMDRRLEQLSKAYPNVEVRLNREMPERGRVIAKATDSSKAVIELNPDLLADDTISHEFGHVFIDMVGGISNPSVKRIYTLSGQTADTEIGQKEIVAQLLGRAMEMQADSPIRQTIGWLMARLKQILGIGELTLVQMASLSLKGQVGPSPRQVSPYYQYQVNAKSQYELSKEQSKAENLAKTLRNQVMSMAAEIKTLNIPRPSASEAEKRKIAETLETLKTAQDNLVDAIQKQEWSAALHMTMQYAEKEVADISKEIVELAGADASGAILSISARHITGLIGRLKAIEISPAIVESLPEQASTAAMQQSLRTVHAQVTSALSKMTDLSRAWWVERMLPYGTAYDHQVRQEYSEKVLADNPDLQPGEVIIRRDKLMEQDRQAIMDGKRKYLFDSIRLSDADLGFVEQYLEHVRSSSQVSLQVIATIVDQAKAHVNEEFLAFERLHSQVHQEFIDKYGRKMDPAETYAMFLEQEDGVVLPRIVQQYDYRYFEDIERIYDKIASEKLNKQEADKLWQQHTTQWKLVADDNWISEYQQARKEGRLDEFRRKHSDKPAWYRGYTPDKQFLNQKFAKFDPKSPEYLGDNDPAVKYFRLISKTKESTDSFVPRGRHFGANLAMVSRSFIESARSGSGQALWKTLQNGFRIDRDYDQSGEELAVRNVSGRKERSKYVISDASGGTRSMVNIYHANFNSLKTDGKYDPAKLSDQSFDLPSLIETELFVKLNYKHMVEVANDYELVKHVVSEMDIEKRDSVGTAVLNALGRNVLPDDSPVKFKGVQSNLMKALYDYGESHIYGNRLADTHFFGLNAQAWSSVMTYTGYLLLAGNLYSAGANMMQGVTNSLIESFSRKFFHPADYANGEKLYMKDIVELTYDSSRTLRLSLTNILSDLFGMEGDISGSRMDYVRGGAVGQNMKLDRAMGGLQATEHHMARVVMYSMLSAAKFVDADGKYIVADGQQASPKNARTLAEAFSAKDGQMQFKPVSDQVLYNGKIYRITDEMGRLDMNTVRELGNTMRQISTGMFGAYSNWNRANYDRVIWARLLMMFRKFAPVGMQRRWFGFTSIKGYAWDSGKFDMQDNIEMKLKRLSRQEQIELYLSNKKDNQARMSSRRQGVKYDIALDEMVQGYHTTLLMHAAETIADFWRLGLSTSWELSKQRKKDMPEWKKQNIRRAYTDMLVSISAYALYMLTMMLAKAADDDEEDYYYAGAYLARRTFSEISFYWNPLEFARILQNPAASLSVANRTARFLWQFHDIDEVYEGGEKDGQYKLLYYGSTLIPGYHMFTGSAKQKLEDTY